MPRIVYISCYSALKMLFALFVLFVTTAIANAQTFTTLASFGSTSDGTPQFATLVRGVDGALYGTTDNLEDGPGTVFRLGTDGNLGALYTFCSLPECADGDVPFSGVIVGTDGNLYGVTYGGGAYYAGTVFRLALDGSLSTLYSFCSQSPCVDGRAPFGGLVQGTDGNFYGTTAAGGLYDDGTVFKITAAGALKTLYSFCARGYPCPDGYSPEAALTEGIDGNFYGSTFGGSDLYYSAGSTLFKITPTGEFTTLWSFSDGFSENGGPLAPLLQLGDGAFYGTLTGSPNGSGTIFKARSDGTKPALLYNFCDQKNCSDGHYPSGALVFGTDGNLYGTTGGGANTTCPGGCGTVFQARKGKFTTLYSFCAQSGCMDGYEPLGGLTQATNGVFYGTTWLGGAHGGGTAFSLNMGLDPFVTFIIPAGKVGQKGGILGQGFIGTTAVTLNGTPASFTVVSDTFIKATVPAGATTGYVTVATPTGTLTSNVPFHVIP